MCIVCVCVEETTNSLDPVVLAALNALAPLAQDRRFFENLFPLARPLFCSAIVSSLSVQRKCCGFGSVLAAGIVAVSGSLSFFL